MSAKKFSVTGSPASDPAARKSLTNRPHCQQGAAMLSEKAWVATARSLKLSGRELQVVRGIFDDETNLAIARQLGISLHTVHTHVERLHRKLAIMNRSQLLLRVMQEFLTLTISPKNELPPICAHRGLRYCPFNP